MVSENEKLELFDDIIEIFEDFLNDRGITIQNDEKTEALYETDDPDSIANIYGTDYGDLESSLEYILKKWKVIE